MNAYNIFQALYLSFFSKKLYQDVAKNWGAKSILYLLMIIALSWIATTIQIQNRINSGYSTNSELLVQQIPVLSIKDGKLSTPQNKPYLIAAPKSHEVFAIIDTSGKYKDISQTNAIILITPSQIITKPKKNETRIYQIPASFSKVINPVTVNESIKSVVGYLWIIIYLAMVLITFFIYLIKSLIYGVIGKILCITVGVSLSYWQIVQVAMVAFTPPLIFICIESAFSIQYTHASLLSFLISMIYLAFAILSNKSATD